MASMDNSDITGRRQKRDHEDSSTHSNKRQCTIREGIDTQQSATKDSSCTPQKTTNNGLSSSAKRNREIRTKRKQQERIQLSQGKRNAIRAYDRKHKQNVTKSLSSAERINRTKRNTECQRRIRAAKRRNKSNEKGGSTTSPTSGKCQDSKASSTPIIQDKPPASEEECVPEVVISVEEPVKKALEYVTRPCRGNGKHQVPVCVICDRFIIGTETIHQLDKQRILMSKHRLSVEAYEKHFSTKLNPILVKQYEIEGLEDLLLSPRSYRNNDSFEACSCCNNSLMPSVAKKTTKPPKWSIANGFAFGSIPQSLKIKNVDGEEHFQSIEDHDISDIISAALSIQRPFGYVFAYYGGAHQSIKGQVSFFEMDQSHIGGVVNHFRSKSALQHILCTICGRMTKDQKKLARSWSVLNTELYLALLNFLIENHEGYSDVTPPDDIEQPQFLQDPPSSNNTDSSTNRSVEVANDGNEFTFASSRSPNESNSVYKNNAEFTIAVLNHQSPKMLLSGGKYVNSGTELKLECVFPTVFPFGIGGPKMNRPVNVSNKACLQHYLRISLPQFMRSKFILVINNLYNRLLSYQSGITVCKSISIGGSTLAESLASITEEEIKSASENRSNNVPDSSVAALLLKKSETSCKAIAHSQAAAKYNRRLMFALCDRFGLPNVFFTLTPDDECSWRVRLYAMSGKEHEMPSLDCEERDCIVDFKIRKRSRMMYPGACSIEYQSIVQILLEVLFGWDSKKQEGSCGILGTLDAYSVAHEEQGKFTTMVYTFTNLYIYLIV